MQRDAAPQETPSYRSGVAARLAGVPVETLRVWERRYGVVNPRVSNSGQRLYSSDEIRRLGLIKQLVDMGHPIGVIARLPADALLAMRATSVNLAAVEEQPGPDRPRPRVILVGPVISRLQMENRGATYLNIVGRCADPAAVGDPLRALRAEAVVIEMPTLQAASPALVETVKQTLGTAQAIVLYRFGPSAVIRQLRESGHAVARAPSDAAEIDSLCGTLLQTRAMPQPPASIRRNENPGPPRFDEEELMQLAAGSATVYCECPRHLVDLLLSLTSFERYSSECSNRDAEDAALHKDLQRTAGHARAMLEEALVRVATAEGLRIPDGTRS